MAVILASSPRCDLLSLMQTRDLSLMQKGVSTVRAAIVRASGGPEALQIEEAPLPQAPVGWIRIRVKAIGLSRSEIYARRGDYAEVSFPRVLGTECVGVVDNASNSALPPGSVVVAVMGGMGRVY